MCLFFLALFFFLERKGLHILHRPWGSTYNYITNQVHEAREVHENVYCDRKVSLTRSTTMLSMFSYLFNIALRNPSLFRAFVHKWHDRIFWTKLTAFRSIFFFFFFGVEVVSHSCCDGMRGGPGACRGVWRPLKLQASLNNHRST